MTQPPLIRRPWLLAWLLLAAPALAATPAPPTTAPATATTAPASTPAPGRPATQPAFDPTDRYRPRVIEGWKVLVNSRLLDEQPELASAVLRELENQLYRITRVVPAPALEKIRPVTIWVELADRDVKGGVYHPSRQWLAAHGFNPDKARCVELGNARNFVSWSLDQPWMVLHELAHAYHHQVLGYDHPGIKAAYQAAVASKTYESVLHIRGRQERHYALTSDQEYFAECSEAFFGRNDFYPFVRAELKQHDPKAHDLLAEVWGGEKRR